MSNHADGMLLDTIEETRRRAAEPLGARVSAARVAAICMSRATRASLQERRLLVIYFASVALPAVR